MRANGRLLAIAPLACENLASDRRTRFHSLGELALMKVIPLGDKIVVKRLAAEARTAGGIVLPDSAKEKPQEGRVLSVGDGRLLDDGTRCQCQVQEGDRVIF